MEEWIQVDSKKIPYLSVCQPFLTPVFLALNSQITTK